MPSKSCRTMPLELYVLSFGELTSVALYRRKILLTTSPVALNRISLSRAPFTEGPVIVAALLHASISTVSLHSPQASPSLDRHCSNKYRGPSPARGRTELRAVHNARRGRASLLVRPS